MVKLEGIIYKAFGNFVALRGFAEIADLASVSTSSKSYQRIADESHKKEIVRFMKDGKYIYFPDIILACRAENYSDFSARIGVDDDVDFSDASFVEGLTVMHEYLPVKGHRARHASLDIGNDKKLFRIDGNHRLEPFDEPMDWWYNLKEIPQEIAVEEDEKKKEGWLLHQAVEYRKEVGRKIVPYTIIFTDQTIAEDLEAGIFHNINFRHLPLKEESSLRIISELNTFSFDSLGNEYLLTEVLIDKAKKGFFRGISLLTPSQNEKNSIFRTSCLRIAQLIYDKKSSEKDLENLYWKDGFIDLIEEVIQSLRPIYKKWGASKQGSTALLAALVYYGLKDPAKQHYFIQWADNNGINRISQDNVSRSTALSFVEMFDKVYQTKKSEVFISMQFNDPQSELIYEKIVRAIETYNKQSSRDIQVRPLRIDKYIKGETYTITDEILNAIESSSLVIADLSSGNKNVYHEIGYAMALAKVKDIAPSVLLLLKENTNQIKEGEDIDKFVGFNIRGFSQVRFNNYDDLVELLVKQLKAHFEN
jgi:hypothetical protein